MFKITSINEDRWIFISSPDSVYDSDSFVKLVQEYNSQLNGEFVEISSDMQYIITSDPLKLIFQWDGLFGITVVVSEDIDMSVARDTLQKLCDTLNYRN